MIGNRAKNSDYVVERVTDYTLDSPTAEKDIDWSQPATNYKVEPYTAGHHVFSSKVEAWKSVRFEYRLEFATEGLRSFQLRHWGIDGDFFNDFIAEYSQFRGFMQGVTYNTEEDDYSITTIPTWYAGCFNSSSRLFLLK